MNALAWAGRLVGIAGIVLCALTAWVRFRGHFFLAGYPAGILFQGGIAAVIIGCFCLLAVLSARR